MNQVLPLAPPPCHRRRIPSFAPPRQGGRGEEQQPLAEVGLGDDVGDGVEHQLRPGVLGVEAGEGHGGVLHDGQLVEVVDEAAGGPQAQHAVPDPEAQGVLVEGGDEVPAAEEVVGLAHDAVLEGVVEDLPAGPEEGAPQLRVVLGLPLVVGLGPLLVDVLGDLVEHGHEVLGDVLLQLVGLGLAPPLPHLAGAGGLAGDDELEPDVGVLPPEALVDVDDELVPQHREEDLGDHGVLEHAAVVVHVLREDGVEVLVGDLAEALGVAQLGPPDDGALREGVAVTAPAGHGVVPEGVEGVEALRRLRRPLVVLLGEPLGEGLVGRRGVRQGEDHVAPAVAVGEVGLVQEVEHLVEVAGLGVVDGQGRERVLREQQLLLVGGAVAGPAGEVLDLGGQGGAVGALEGGHEGRPPPRVARLEAERRLGHEVVAGRL